MRYGDRKVVVPLGRATRAEHRNITNAQPPAAARQRGAAYVMALIVSAVVLTVSSSLIMSSTVETITAYNSNDIRNARLLAESGTAFIGYHLQHFDIDADVTTDNLLSTLSSQLQTALGASIDAGSVTSDSYAVYVPAVHYDPNINGWFSAYATFTNLDPTTSTIELTVIGSVTAADGQTITRQVITSYEFHPGTSGPPEFDFPTSIFAFGVATNGPIRMTGGTYIKRWIRTGNDLDQNIGIYTGYTGASEALDLTGDYTIDLTGGPLIEGMVVAVDDDPTTFFSGNPSINGVRLWDYGQDIHDQVAVGVDPVEFPMVDSSVFEPLAPATPSAHVSAYNDPANYNAYINTLSSIRIGANTNPNISSDTTINGIVYVEAPNIVKFTAGARVNGIIITEDGASAGGTCRLEFSGGFQNGSVDALPAGSQYDAIRQMRNVAILAPGFDLKFTGGTASVGGTVYGKSIDLSGGAAIRAAGAVIATSDHVIELTGGGAIQIDLSDFADSGELPPGFYYAAGSATATPGYLAGVTGTYREE